MHVLYVDETLSQTTMDYVVGCTYSKHVQGALSGHREAASNRLLVLSNLQ
eukprot:m.456538 g.456538  ORF g.456538 m.456538 type:complete len:50 (+) comp21072_c0_seq1:24-173(+)